MKTPSSEPTAEQYRFVLILALLALLPQSCEDHIKQQEIRYQEVHGRP